MFVVYIYQKIYIHVVLGYFTMIKVYIYIYIYRDRVRDRERERESIEYVFLGYFTVLNMWF